MISVNLREVSAQEVHGTFGLCKGSDPEPEPSPRIAASAASSLTTTNSKAQRIRVCACFDPLADCTHGISGQGRQCCSYRLGNHGDRNS